MHFTNDIQLMDFEWIYAQLSTSYWSKDIPRHIVETGMRNALCFAALDENGCQLAFARVISDRATFGYLADVVVEPSRRGEGIGKALMDNIMEHPDLQSLRRFMLMTRDAHELYKGYGFSALKSPEKAMEIVRSDIYTQGQSNVDDR